MASESNANVTDQSILQQVLQSSVLPNAINLNGSTMMPMTPDQLRQFVLKLPTSTHVTSLNLSHQSIAPDLLLELIGSLALLTSLRELHLAGACALTIICACALQHLMIQLLT